jgi:transcriptional regulator with XRE-family HTH domain
MVDLVCSNARRWRTHHGLHLADVAAAAAGWDVSALSRFERGERKRFPIEKLFALAEATRALRADDPLSAEQLADRAPWTAPEAGAAA